MNSDLITHLGQMLSDAEDREDPIDAAWARHSRAHAQRTAAQMQAVEDLLLALIPKRERGALTALVIEERMPRMAAAVEAAVVEAKTVANEMSEEDQQRREQRIAAAAEEVHHA